MLVLLLQLVFSINLDVVIVAVSLIVTAVITGDLLNVVIIFGGIVDIDFAVVRYFCCALNTSGGDGDGGGGEDWRGSKICWRDIDFGIKPNERGYLGGIEAVAFTRKPRARQNKQNIKINRKKKKMEEKKLVLR